MPDTEAQPLDEQPQDGAPQPEPAPAPAVDVQAEIERALAMQKAELEQRHQEALSQAMADNLARLDAKDRDAATLRTLYEQNAIKAAVLSAAGQAISPDLVLTLLGGHGRVAEDGSVSINGQPAKDAVDELLNKNPFLAKPQGMPGSGAPHQPSFMPGGHGNPWSREHLNLTEQSRISRENPAEAQRLKAAAGT